jgi:hypothetical protein
MPYRPDQHEESIMQKKRTIEIAVIGMALLLAGSSYAGSVQGNGGVKGSGGVRGHGIARAHGTASGTGIVIYRDSNNQLHYKKGTGTVSGRGIAIGRGTVTGTGKACGHGQARGHGRFHR